MDKFREAGYGLFRILLLAGMVALVVAGIQWGSRQPLGPPLILQPAPSPGPIVVQISGAVNKPGVYSLPHESRLQDGIQTAGGLAENANPETINLAALLEDGQRVIVATLRPTVSPALQTEISAQRTTSLTQTTFPLNINLADAAALETLPEIGPVMAGNIIAYRDANGSFGSIEEIQNVPGIGPATFEAIKDLITVSP